MYLSVQRESIRESETASRSPKSDRVWIPSDNGDDAICANSDGLASSEMPIAITFDLARSNWEDSVISSVDSPSVMTRVMEGTPTRAPYIGFKT